jgi:hypothetical protein
MREIEAGSGRQLEERLRAGALAGLGSKYLAVGSPASIGLIHCGDAATAIFECHEIVFGCSWQLRIAGNNLLDVDSLPCDIEEAMACDVVCLPCHVDFELEWIADGTHINLRNTGAGTSVGVARLLQAADITVESQTPPPLLRAYSSLQQVITGLVKGRMGEEVTVLFHD